MTKGQSDSPHGSITPNELRIELERLGTHFPRTDMNPAKWVMLAQDFWEDCRHLSLPHLRDLCRAYRQDPDNRFFPTPGQLLNASHRPWDDIHIPRHEQKALPTPVLSEEQAAERSRMLTELAGKLREKPEPLVPLESPTVLELREKSRPYDLARLAAQKAGVN